MVGTELAGPGRTGKFRKWFYHTGGLDANDELTHLRQVAYGIAQAHTVTVLGSTALLAQAVISPVFLGEVRKEQIYARVTSTVLTLFVNQ